MSTNTSGASAYLLPIEEFLFAYMPQEKVNEIVKGLHHLDEEGDLPSELPLGFTPLGVPQPSLFIPRDDRDEFYGEDIEYDKLYVIWEAEDIYQQVTQPWVSHLEKVGKTPKLTRWSVTC